MARPVFYHNTIKNIIVAFGIIFDNIRYINDEGIEIKVPIHYAPKEKFVSYFMEKADFDQLDMEIQLPRMAFEITSLNFAPERFVNPLNRISDSTIDEKKYMFSRIPYDFQFNLYIATKKFEDSLKIVEQIMPIFTPEFNITIKDKEDFGLRTDIPVILNSAGFDIEYEGTYETKRTIMWTLGFTAKGWLYGDVKQQNVIKKTITDLSQPDFDRKFATLISEVVPNTAGRNDPHTIVDTIIE
jgi:hypothetical protein